MGSSSTRAWSIYDTSNTLIAITNENSLDFLDLEILRSYFEAPFGLIFILLTASYVPLMDRICRIPGCSKLLLLLIGYPALRTAAATAADPANQQHSWQTPLVFIHVPKTAGSTVTAVFKSIFAEELKCSRDPLSSAIFKGPVPPPDARCTWAWAYAAPDGDDRNFLGRVAMGGGGGNGTTRADGDPTSRQIHIDALIGHVSFGICPLINSTMPNPCSYTTVLRHPLDRVLSHYSYLMQVAPQVVLEECPTCGDVDAFARALVSGSLHKLQLDNTATRMISGDGLLASLSSNRIDDVSCATDAMMLRRAKTNLAQHFAVVGFQEDLPAYVRALRGFFGLPADASGAPLPTVNPTLGRRVTAGGLSAETRTLLMRSQSYDMHLYEFARRMVRRRGLLLRTESGGVLESIT